MDEIGRIKKIKDKLRSEQSKYDMLKGKLEEKERLLKETFDISTLEEAKALLTRKEKELSIARSKLTAKLADIEAKYV